MDRLVCDMGRSEGFNLLRGGITSANTCSSPSRERLRSTAAMLKKLIQERMCRVICEGDVWVTVGHRYLTTGRGKDSPKGWARVRQIGSTPQLR